MFGFNWVGGKCEYIRGVRGCIWMVCERECEGTS